MLPVRGSWPLDHPASKAQHLPLADRAFPGAVDRVDHQGRPGVEVLPVDGPVRGHHDEHVRPVEQRVQPDTHVDAAHVVTEAFDQRVVVAELRAAIEDQRQDGTGRRVAGIHDVRLERDAQHAHARALERLAAVVESLGHQVHHVARHGEVDVPGELDEALREIELPGTPGEVVRVHGDAVAANARARGEAHETEWFRGGGVDDLPHVEAHSLAQQRQLVDERDVDVAEGVLEQLRHLGGVGRGHLDHPVVDVREQRRGALRGRLGRAAHEPRHTAPGAGRVTGAHPLGREGEVEVPARGQPRCLDDLAEGAGSRAREGGRLEHDEMPGPEPVAHEGRRREHGPEIGVLGGGDRRRDAHEQRIGGSGAGVARSNHAQTAAQCSRQALVADVVDGGVPGVELGDTVRRRVHALDLEAGLRKRDRQGKADVTEADDRDAPILCHGSSRSGGQGVGVAYGARTRNLRSHNPMLCH